MDSRAVWIARENITRFERLLLTTKDTTELKMIGYLLAVEEGKLAILVSSERV